MTDTKPFASNKTKPEDKETKFSSHQASIIKDTDSLNKVSNELQEAVQSALKEVKVKGNKEAAYNAQLMEAIKCLATIFIQTQMQSKTPSANNGLLKEFKILLEENLAHAERMEVNKEVMM